MASHSTARSTTGNGMSRLEGIQRMNPNSLGVLLFISSEVVFFGALIITYITYRTAGPPGPTARTVLNIPLTSVFTVFLLSSSYTMHRATSRLVHNDASGVRKWLLATVLLGAIFIVGQGYEYVHLYMDSVTISRNIWASTFFVLTGFHGLHVIIGLIAMAVIASVIQPGEDHPWGAAGVEAISYYWHFVDAVWVVIFPVVYLWALFS